jgi:hypothetical protein
MEELREIFSGAVSGLVVSIAGWFSSRGADERKKIILKRCLLDKQYGEWRTMKTLRRRIGWEDEATTRRLLLELGAERSAGENDVWRWPT